MKRRLRGMLPLLLPLLLLTGCWQEEPPEEPEEMLPSFEEEPVKEVKAALPERFALPYMPGRSLDPVDCADGMQQTVSSLLYEGLFRLDGRFEAQPCLCVSYTHDETAGRYTFAIREGVQFSDGSLLTARDVKASLDRARESERYRSRLSEISSISVKGDSVTIVLSSPNAAFPALLDVPIVKSGSQDSPAPLGTGPYFYAEEETGAYLIANQSWWRGERQPVERIALVEAPDNDAMLYRFSSHEVQLITADLTGVTAVSTTGSVGCVDAETAVMQYVGCNTAAAPLDSTALRQALPQEQKQNLDLIMNVSLEVAVEIGRTRRKIQDIIAFSKGSLVVLDKLAGDQVDLLVNGQCVARGDVVVIDDNFGIRITEILEKPDINELAKYS